MNKWIQFLIKCSEVYGENKDLVEKVINSSNPARVIDDYYSRNEEKTIEHLKEVKEELRGENQDLVDQIGGLLDKLENYQLPDIAKKYENKYSKKNIFYRRHETDGIYQVDVRDYFQVNDSKLPDISGDTDDEVALNSLKWIIDNIDYISDKSNYGYSEYWAYPYQILKRGRDDCEGGSTLLANIMLANGIPYWKVRLNAGWVYDRNGNRQGGHCWTTYLCEEQDEFKSMDWCYYPNKKPVKERPDYKEAIIYGKGSVWFSWNKLHAYHDGTALPTNIDLDFEIK